MKTIAIFLAQFVLAAQLASQAADYYVSPTGDDASLSGAIGHPFKSLKKGVAQLKAPGDTLYLRGGVYRNQAIAVAVSGTATQPIKILAYPNEVPVIEGDNRTQTAKVPHNLVVLGGNHIFLSGLEVRYSTGPGISVTGSYDCVSNVFSHHNYNEGIKVSGKGYSNIVEYCDVWWNVCENENARNAIAGKNWGTGLCAARAPHGTILRHNKVHDNWGEGLDTYEAYDTLIEDNVVYDNWSVNLYTSDTPNSVVRRNLVYNTPQSPVARAVNAHLPELQAAKVNNRIARGIVFCDEVAARGRSAWSTNVQIYNNIVIGCRGNFKYVNLDLGGRFSKPLQQSELVHPTGLQGCLIAYNTFVNSWDPDPARPTVANFNIGKGAHQNTRIENNLFVQEPGGRLDDVVADPELHFSHNLWSEKPSPQVAGSGDIIGNPRLAKTGATGAGQLTPDYFKVTAGSPAIGRAKTIAEVKDDLFEKARGSHPTIGAYEFKP